MNIQQGKLPNSKNYKKSRSAYIKYIVIHYTANKGDTALNNVKYFANNVTESSAHYFVDESNVYSSVPVGDTAWHCGGKKQSNTGGKWYLECNNSNSVGIEMCLHDKAGNIRPKTIINAVELVKELMVKYNIPEENVIRHWDVTGKLCPAPFVGDNNAYWQDFKNRISTNKEEQGGVEMIYNNIGEVPGFAYATVKKLCDAGYLKGDNNGLNLTYDMVRMLVILDRTGVFDKE